MKVMLDSRWTDGYPDYERSTDEYRVQILALQNLERLEGVYFVRQPSLRTLWNYLHELGPAGVIRKVRSRLRESGRNEKYVSCGFARVLEAPAAGRYARGDVVVFLAPIAPACVERLVLPEALLLAAPAAASLSLHDGGIRYWAETPALAEEARWWRSFRAWSSYSGQYLPPAAGELALMESLELLRRLDVSAAQLLPVEDAAVSARLEPAAAPARTQRPSATLFGYGNYAKTTVLPNLAGHLDVTCIHEIDPTQIPVKPAGRRDRIIWDTSPSARPDESADAFLIAGYHHTHAPLACQALRRGAAAVIEKPIATTRTQLRNLLAAMSETGGDVYACFQRRYLPFNDWARQDLDVRPGDPISYHCIVYEVPLVEHHWYRWPNSRSRLVSNGCHWIDHFLFMNDYCAVDQTDLSLAPDGSINCSVTLDNGAFFSMVLTDRGSARIGVQEHMELRANGVTVKMVNQCRYDSEDGDRVIRRKRINKLEGYRRMYRSITERIVSGQAGQGDSLRSVQATTELVLALEDRVTLLTSTPPFPVAGLVPPAEIPADELARVA